MDEETTKVIDVNQDQSDNELESGELEDSSGKSFYYESCLYSYSLIISPIDYVQFSMHYKGLTPLLCTPFVCIHQINLLLQKATS